MNDDESYGELAELLGLGGGGLLLVRVMFWLIPKFGLVSVNFGDKLNEMQRIQNIIIHDIKHDREAFTEYLEEFTEIVGRVDQLESGFDDRRLIVDKAFEDGDNSFRSLEKDKKKLETRVESLESEDKVLSKAIHELSKSNAVLLEKIQPMQESIKELKDNQSKISEVLVVMSADLNKLVGKIGV